MSNFFVSASKKIENSPWIFLLFFLFCWMTVLSAGLLWEDFQANLGVAAMIPTRKAVSQSVIIMAAFLQIAPIALGYTFLRDTNKSFAGFASLMFLAVDWFLGWYFRSNGLSTNWKVYAAAEDFIFFTVGSEVFLLLSVGMAASLSRPALNQMSAVLVSMFYKHDEPAQQKQQNQNRNQNQNRQHQPPYGHQQIQGPMEMPDMDSAPVMIQNGFQIPNRQQMEAEKNRLRQLENQRRSGGNHRR